MYQLCTPYLIFQGASSVHVFILIYKGRLLSTKCFHWTRDGGKRFFSHFFLIFICFFPSILLVSLSFFPFPIFSAFPSFLYFLPFFSSFFPLTLPSLFLYCHFSVSSQPFTCTCSLHTLEGSDLSIHVSCCLLVWQPLRHLALP